MTKIPDQKSKLSELREYEKTQSMQSDIFGDGKQPILADYLERMDNKGGAKAQADSKERPDQKLLQLSGRKKKSGDANERDLGETSTPFAFEFEQGEMHQSPLRTP